MKSYIVNLGTVNRKVKAINPLIAAMYSFPNLFTYSYLSIVAMKPIDLKSWNISMRSAIMTASLIVVDVTDQGN